MNIILEHATSMTCSGSSTVRASVMIVQSLHKAGHNHRQWDFRPEPMLSWLTKQETIVLLLFLDFA